MTDQTLTLPSDAELKAARAIGAGINDIDDKVLDSLPKQMADTIIRLRDIQDVVEAVTERQPLQLAPYAEQLIDMAIHALELEEDDAYAFVGKLFSSTVMARIIADVAVGKITPVVSAEPAKRTRGTRTKPKVELEEATTGDEPAALSELEPDEIAAVIADDSSQDGDFDSSAEPADDAAVGVEVETGGTDDDELPDF